MNYSFEIGAKTFVICADFDGLQRLETAFDNTVWYKVLALVGANPTINDVAKAVAALSVPENGVVKPKDVIKAMKAAPSMSGHAIAANAIGTAFKLAKPEEDTAEAGATGGDPQDPPA